MADSFPFVLGVSGKRKLGAPEEQEEREAELREVVHAVLDWLRKSPAKPGALDPARRRFDPNARVAVDEPQAGELDPWWRPLGLAHTPIVVLTSLAPGADTVVAEAALDYAEEHGARVSVRAALPFPATEYARSTSFDLHAAAARARYERLLERIRAQEGFRPERDLVHVALAPELEADPDRDLTASTADGRARCDLRYRAAGEHVATRSHLLLGVLDESEAPPADLGDLYVPGTAAIVEVKLRGASHGLLAGVSELGWADAGPVLRVPPATDRPLALVHASEATAPSDSPATNGSGATSGSTTTSGSGATSGSAATSGAERESDEAAPAASEAKKATPGQPAARRPRRHVPGDGALRGIARQQESFNAVLGDEDGPTALDAYLGDSAERMRLEARAPALAAALMPLARLYARADRLALAMHAKRQSLLLRLVALVLLAAAAIGAYEHWAWHGAPERIWLIHGVPAEHAPWFVRDAAGIARTLLLLCATGAVLASGVLFWRYRLSGAESKRFDYRAIAEGLRVQLAWCLSGVSASVAAEYTLRQRGELAWIRYALMSVVEPLEAWTSRWKELPRPTRAELLELVRRRWVQDQRDWTRKGAKKNERSVHLWHPLGWSLAAAGFVNILGKLLGSASPAVHHAMEHHTGAFAVPLVVGGIVLLVVYLVRAPRGPEHRAHALHEGPDPARGFWRWVFDRPLLWGVALVVGGVVLWGGHALGGLVPHGPNAHEWWMILTGLLLLGGALSLAWSERNFHSEHARQYRALAALYERADRRLGDLIGRYRDTALSEDERERTLEEIQSLLHQLGREALSENAEWLVLHRTRPLEPFMAG